MPVRRGDDGTPFEEPTTRYEADRPTDYIGGGTIPLGQNRGVGGASQWDRPTEVVPPGGFGAGQDDEPKTRIVGARRASADPVMPGTSAPKDPMEDPPAGWLVVVKGPGQGRVVTLGAGTNSIGRASTERVQVDFGDETISRTGHAVITYDPRGRMFYLQHGGGKNLTYLGDAPVLAPTPLPASAEIQIGETVFRFVPLCGKDFDWGDRR